MLFRTLPNPSYGFATRQAPKKRKPTPKDPCAAVCSDLSKDAECAACQAGGALMPYGPMYGCPPQGVGRLMTAPTTYQGFNAGASTCATTCSPLSNGKCACYTAGGDTISCTCPTKLSFSAFRPRLNTFNPSQPVWWAR